MYILVSELSQAVVDAGAVPLLVLCIQEPEMPLKRIAASALSDICKHSPEVSYTEPIISNVIDKPHDYLLTLLCIQCHNVLHLLWLIAMLEM